MAYQHKEQAQGAWAKHDLIFQMANIGSEVYRAMKWQEKNPEIARHAFERSLELFDLTIEDQKNIGRLKEVLRAREAWVDYFAYDNSYHSTREQWEKYFLEFAAAANNSKMKKIIQHTL
ncbi:MAG: hypothetical protein HYV34_03560 [Candidatus Kerfeldbacteria bacterium]|nr:hypothetical protein [Candidatus Kerfeldbacteria bacterium]